MLAQYDVLLVVGARKGVMEYKGFACFGAVRLLLAGGGEARKGGPRVFTLAPLQGGNSPTAETCFTSHALHVHSAALHGHRQHPVHSRALTGGPRNSHP